MECSSDIFLEKILPFALGRNTRSLIGVMVGSHSINILLFSCVLLKKYYLNN